MAAVLLYENQTGRSKKYTLKHTSKTSQKVYIKVPLRLYGRPQSSDHIYGQIGGGKMDNRVYGYARVSTREQNEDRQIESLTKFGVPEQNIIIDKASGKDTEREGYQYLKRQILHKGDTLVIKELDRLSRNKTDIKRELEEFKGMGIRVKILDIPTTLTDFPPEQAWVLEMINAILIEVLEAIAENERKKIRARQREGIEAAKKKNVRFGRPPKSLPEN